MAKENKYIVRIGGFLCSDPLNIDETLKTVEEMLNDGWNVSVDQI